MIIHFAAPALSHLRPALRVAGPAQPAADATVPGGRPGQLVQRAGTPTRPPCRHVPIEGARCSTATPGTTVKWRSKVSGVNVYKSQYIPLGETNALSVDAAPRGRGFRPVSVPRRYLVSGWSQVTADGGAAAQDGDLCASPAVSRTRGQAAGARHREAARSVVVGQYFADGVAGVVCHDRVGVAVVVQVP
jgi:hypothetical protein